MASFEVRMIVKGIPTFDPDDEKVRSIDPPDAAVTATVDKHTYEMDRIPSIQQALVKSAVCQMYFTIPWPKIGQVPVSQLFMLISLNICIHCVLLPKSFTEPN